MSASRRPIWTPVLRQRRSECVRMHLAALAPCGAAAAVLRSGIRGLTRHQGRSAHRQPTGAVLGWRRDDRALQISHAALSSVNPTP